VALTPLDIYNKEFKKQVFGGLNKDEVDDFLDEVMQEMETLLKENASLKEQVTSLNLKLEHYRNLEDSLNRTLVVAQTTADDIKANARREADLIIQEARLQAERIIEAGYSKSRKYIEQQGDVLRQIDALRNQLRGTGHELLRLADQLPQPTAQEAPAPVVLPHPAAEYQGVPAADHHAHAAASQAAAAATPADQFAAFDGDEQVPQAPDTTARYRFGEDE
jgi:cell division initiation protein